LPIKSEWAIKNLRSERPPSGFQAWIFQTQKGVNHMRSEVLTVVLLRFMFSGMPQNVSFEGM